MELKKRPIKEVKQKLKDDSTLIAVGTHALIENDVEFNNLALCVCDEQQRFGVAQRSALIGKGNSTDILVMSATPIPRTLSLIFYGDLDISTITDKPIWKKIKFLFLVQNVFIQESFTIQVSLSIQIRQKKR